MVRTLALVSKPYSDASDYRALGPLIALEDSGDIQLTLGADHLEAYNWHTFRRTDLFFVHRPYLPSQALAILQAKHAGTPVWVEMDENVFNPPYDHPNYKEYMDNSNRMAVIQSLQLADIVTVPTQALADIVAEYCARVDVVPSAYNDLAYGTDRPDSQREKLVLWKGEPHQARDLLEVSDDIVELAGKFPDWQWAFIGFNPTFLTERMKHDSYKIQQYVSMSHYLNLANRMRPAVQIVPLSDSKFNRCRANTEYLEACNIGAIPLVRNWPEWDNNSSFNYFDHKASFKLSLEHIISYHPKSSSTLPGAAKVLSHVNNTRKGILQDIVQRETCIES